MGLVLVKMNLENVTIVAGVGLVTMGARVGILVNGGWDIVGYYGD